MLRFAELRRGSPRFAEVAEVSLSFVEVAEAWGQGAVIRVSWCWVWAVIRESGDGRRGQGPMKLEPTFRERFGIRWNGVGRTGRSAKINIKVRMKTWKGQIEALSSPEGQTTTTND